MSIYTYILEAALSDRTQPDTGMTPSTQPDARMTTSDALAVLIDCQRQLGSIASRERSADWSATALANQVAYDLALIDLARSVGLSCEPRSFDQPQQRRIELQRELLSLGIRLGELDHQASST